jgi:hypothetical protein
MNRKRLLVVSTLCLLPIVLFAIAVYFSSRSMPLTNSGLTDIHGKPISEADWRRIEVADEKYYVLKHQLAVKAELKQAESDRKARLATPSSPSPPSITHTRVLRDYCGDANAYEDKAFDYFNNGRHSRSAYNAAVSGLAASAECDDSMRNMHNGFLLSVKGMAEHYLPEGDSQTDLNQANALLVKCQTTPGLYGTHDAAFCETQEQNNISWQIAWRLGN